MEDFPSQRTGFREALLLVGFSEQQVLSRAYDLSHTFQTAEHPFLQGTHFSHLSFPSVNVSRRVTSYHTSQALYGYDRKIHGSGQECEQAGKVFSNGLLLRVLQTPLTPDSIIYFYLSARGHTYPDPPRPPAFRVSQASLDSSPGIPGISPAPPHLIAFQSANPWPRPQLQPGRALQCGRQSF